MTASAAAVTLVLGGAGSGKSRFAEGLAEASGLAPVYIATGQALDEEMAARIARHRERRGPHWRTVDAPLELSEALRREARFGRMVLVDCLTLWISNLMMAEADIPHETMRLVAALEEAQSPVVLVSNEVGLGVVPDNAAARAFRDHAGAVHQAVAECATEVYFVAAGLPVRLKPQ